MVVVEHFSSESGTTSSSSTSSNTSSSKFYRGCVTRYDAAKGTCDVQLIDEGIYFKFNFLSNNLRRGKKLQNGQRVQDE